VEILAQSQEKHLESVMSRELGTRAKLSQADKSKAARSIFAYYRWKNWLNPKATLLNQLIEAVELSNRYREQRSSFSETELRERAVPAWIFDHLQPSPSWLRRLQEEPLLWLRARPGFAAALQSELKVQAFQPNGHWANTLQYLGTDDLFSTSLFKEGAFEIQDLHSQAIGFLCAPQPGERWWDVCAGEGGKMLHLAALMSNQGLLWATDPSTHRLKQLRKRAARAKVFNYRCDVLRDKHFSNFKNYFHGILVDAPCTGIGTWQRSAHHRWTTEPGSVARLAELQAKILRDAVGALRPNGKLVYSVCTLTRAETTEVTRLVSEIPELEPLPTPDPFTGELKFEHWFRAEDRPANGMFAAAWKKVKVLSS